MMAESAVIGRRITLFASARSTMMTWFCSPTFSLTQIKWSLSSVSVYTTTVRYEYSNQNGDELGRKSRPAGLQWRRAGGARRTRWVWICLPVRYRIRVLYRPVKRARSPCSLLCRFRRCRGGGLAIELCCSTPTGGRGGASFNRNVCIMNQVWDYSRCDTCKYP